MAMCRRVCFSASNKILRCSFSTSGSLNNKWRRDQGLESNPRTYGPLNILPDYSFVDGRPQILSGRKVAKLQQQSNICKRIIELTKEIDYGMQMHEERLKQQEIDRENILKNKLKPKGAALLSKSSQKKGPKS